MKIIAVSDRSIAGPDFLSRMAAVIRSGIDVLILREKDLSDEDLGMITDLLEPVCREEGVELILNSAYGLARARGLAVHLPLGVLREHSGELAGLRFGASVHSIGEADKAVSLGASWLIFGNVFETVCKPGKAAAGTDMLESVCRRYDVPVYAIGGIDASNAASCMEAGAAGVCLRSPYMQCADPAELTASVRKSLKERS